MGEQLEISGRLLHRGGKRRENVAVAHGAVQADKSKQPGCNNVIVHVKNKRASPGTCRRWESPSKRLSGAVQPLGCCVPELSATHSCN